MWSDSDFPNLRTSSHLITSPVTPEYNCIAWAAGDGNRWWWPDPLATAYWPKGVPKEETLTAFITAYRSLGYLPCDEASLEKDSEKVALYTIGDKPTHAARQLTSGMWTSKLGPQEDIEHMLEAIEGPAYGRVTQILRRPRK